MDDFAAWLQGLRIPSLTRIAGWLKAYFPRVARWVDVLLEWLGLEPEEGEDHDQDEGEEEEEGDDEREATNLLEHLRQNEGTAHDITNPLATALGKGAAPAPTKRLPDTLAEIYEARKSLKPLFFRGTEAGASLVDDLQTIRVTVSEAFEKNFVDDDLGYYTMIRDAVQHGLDEPVRQPTVQRQVLESPTPDIEGRGVIETWLEDTDPKSDGLPDVVRAEVLHVLREAELTLDDSQTNSDGGTILWLTLGEAWVKEIEEVFELALAFDPRNASTYRWWLRHFNRPEWHHTWPKWMRGRVKQTSELYVPRCVHNMAGDELGQVAIHQTINALFAAEFGGDITVENSTSFDDYYKDLKSEIKQEIFLTKVEGLLLDAYEQVIKESNILSRIEKELAKEFQEISP